MPQYKNVYVPNTFIWETGTIDKIDPNTPQFKELLVRLYQNLNLMCFSLNLKDTGYYILEPVQSSQQWFTPNDNSKFRFGIRKTIDLGALGAGVTNVAHGLNIPVPNTWKFTQIVGAASDTLGNNYYPIPTANLTAYVDAVNVVINNTTGVNFNYAYIVLNWLET